MSFGQNLHSLSTALVPAEHAAQLLITSFGMVSKKPSLSGFPYPGSHCWPFTDSKLPSRIPKSNTHAHRRSINGEKIDQLFIIPTRLPRTRSVLRGLDADILTLSAALILCTQTPYFSTYKSKYRTLALAHAGGSVSGRGLRSFRERLRRSCVMFTEQWVVGFHVRVQQAAQACGSYYFYNFTW